MTEMKAAVDAEKGDGVFNPRAGEDSEIEPSRVNRLLLEDRGFLLFSTKSEKAFAGGAVMRVGHGGKVNVSAACCRSPLRLQQNFAGTLARFQQSVRVAGLGQRKGSLDSYFQIA